MRIGIDISQIVYEGSGVARYVTEMVLEMSKQQSSHTIILFGSSLRRRNLFKNFYLEIKKQMPSVELKVIPFPPVLLDFLWNRMHIIPIEWVIGNVDVFWSSDWTQPPLQSAKGITTIHDLIVYTFPEESHNRTAFSLTNFRLSSNIVATQKRRLTRAKKVCSHFLCDSEATKTDVQKFLHIDPAKLSVVYPGFHSDV